VTPADEGPAGTIGFFATIDGNPVPRYLLPAAGKPGERVKMHLRDLDLTPGAEVAFAVRAVDGAGNVGTAAEAKVRVSAKVPAPLPGKPPAPFAELDPARPDKPLGALPRDNAITKQAASAAFLVRFDLERLGLPRGAKVRRATVSFYVWDPSSQGRTKVCAFGMKTPWDEAAATWKEPAAGKAWQGGKSFAVGTDTGPACPPVIVEPDRGSDTVDPPLEYQLDVTALVQGWLDGGPNHGLAVVPVPDRAIDDGNFTRFQMYASEYREVKYTPKLTIRLAPR
jgi:hypothetical protein